MRQRMGIWFTVAVVLLGAVPVGASGLGLYGYQRHLADDDSFCIRPSELNLVKATSWMTPDIAREVRASLQQLPPRLSVMDTDAASRVARCLEANPWIREVEYVRLNRPSGGAAGKGVEISLRMRSTCARASAALRRASSMRSLRSHSARAKPAGGGAIDSAHQDARS